VTYQLDRREVVRARAVLMLQAVEDIQRELAELEGKGVSPGKQRKVLRVIDGGD
jgi:hypothetical protein